MNWEMFVAAIGAAAWIPKFVEYLKPCKIKIKLISEYTNFTKNLFNNKDIKVNIKYKNNKKKKCKRTIWKKTIFNFDKKQK